MEIAVADVIDRFTIVRLKKERMVPTPDSVLREYCELLREIDRVGYEDAHDWVDALYEVNSAIWDLEADIRQAKDLSLEEVGRRALLIRDQNRERVFLKNIICNITKTGFPEFKSDHASG